MAQEDFYKFLKDPGKVKKYLPDLQDLYAKQLGKLLKIEIFDYDLMGILEGKIKEEPKKEKTLLVFNYHNRDKIFHRAKVFRLP